MKLKHDVNKDGPRQPQNAEATRGSTLLWGIFLWVGIFALLFWLTGVLLTQQWLWFRKTSSVESAEDFFTLVTTVLAAVGGVIAISYLVIKYRERSAQEQEEASFQTRQINSDLRAAIEQLGHDKEVVRLAGVHALVDISDNYIGQYKQRVVDILCGYLRADRKYFRDRAVESTILQVIRERTFLDELYKDEDKKPLHRSLLENQMWWNCTFDFHGATLVETVNFSGCDFRESVNFAGTTFAATGCFYKTRFSSEVSFEGARFQSDITFARTHFMSRVRFNSIFEECLALRFVTFCAETVFTKARFQSAAHFEGVTFGKTTMFDGAEFLDSLRISNSSFFSTNNFIESVLFRDTHFWGDTLFYDVEFLEHPDFQRAVFHGKVTFRKARFERLPPMFHGAGFKWDLRTELVFPDEVTTEGGLPAKATWF